MKTDVIFSYEGLKSRIAVTSSCKVFGEKKLANIYALLKVLKAGVDVRAETILNNLPEKDPMIEALIGSAILEGKTVIDENFIWKYFGGNDHIDYVLDQIRVKKLENDLHFADCFLFTHLVIPATLKNRKGSLSAIYKNGKVIVKMDNFVVHPFVKMVMSGDRVLLHQATIVSKKVSKPMEKWLLKEQQREEFMQAAKRIKYIDFETFWGLKKWTENLLKKCEF